MGCIGGVVAGSVDASMSWASSQSSNWSSGSECCVVVVFIGWVIVCWSCFIWKFVVFVRIGVSCNCFFVGSLYSSLEYLKGAPGKLIGKSRPSSSS